MDLTTTVTKNDAETILRIEGALTIGSSEAERIVLLKQFDEGARFTIDLSGITECDAVGLQLLGSAQKSARLRNGRITIRELSQAVAEASFEIGLDPATLFNGDDNPPEDPAGTEERR